MSYTRKTWASGDVVTSASLNDIENACEDFDFRKDFPDIYTSADDVPLFETFNDVIAAYDALVNINSAYMAKQTWTSGSVTNYSYHITLGGYNKSGQRGTRDAEVTRKQIMILSGLHGDEQGAVSSVYTVARDLLKKASLEPMLACTIKILPVGNPSGFDAGTRLSANNVNINRNFDSSNWTQTSSGDNYSGASAGSENETKIIQNWIDANLTNGVLFVDVHNSLYVDEISALLSSNIVTNQIPSYKREYLDAINAIAPYWMNALKLKGSSFVYGYTTVSSNTGTSISYAQEKEIPAYTLELSYNVDSTGLCSDFTIGRGAEALAAFLRQFTIENKFTPVFVPDPFIVTLTPTAEDFSGTMDKDIAEIAEAWRSGKQIVFKIMLSADQWIFNYSLCVLDDQYMSNPEFQASIIDISNNLLIFARTITGTQVPEYATTIYPLTPMS